MWHTCTVLHRPFGKYLSSENCVSHPILKLQSNHQMNRNRPGTNVAHSKHIFSQQSNDHNLKSSPSRHEIRQRRSRRPFAPRVDLQQDGMEKSQPTKSLSPMHTACSIFSCMVYDSLMRASIDASVCSCRRRSRYAGGECARSP